MFTEWVRVLGVKCTKIYLCTYRGKPRDGFTPNGHIQLENPGIYSKCPLMTTKGSIVHIPPWTTGEGKSRVMQTLPDLAW